MSSPGGANVSVVVATFNCAKTLERMLQSVLSQSMVPQLLIADGGSTDGTLEVIRKYRDRIEWFASEPDRGVYDAWNKALEHASGDWVAFLGGDDWFPDEHALAAAAGCIEGLDPRVVVVYGNVRVIDESGNLVRTDNVEHPDMQSVLRRRMPFTHVGALHRRAVFADQGRFDAALRIAGDYDLMLRILRDGEAKYCPQYDVCMGDGGLSNSRKGRSRLLGELVALRRRHRLGWSISIDGYMFMKRLYYRMLP